MLVYLASSLSNRELNQKVAHILASKGYQCFLPQRDAPQNTDGALTAKSNIDAITRANLVLVIAKNFGNDTSWEAGYAKALGKPTFLLCTHNDPIEKSFMMFFSVDKVFRLSSYSEWELQLSRVIDHIAEIGRKTGQGH